jgi:hypothetical protein
MATIEDVNAALVEFARTQVELGTVKAATSWRDACDTHGIDKAFTPDALAIVELVHLNAHGAGLLVGVDLARQHAVMFLAIHGMDRAARFLAKTYGMPEPEPAGEPERFDDEVTDGE